MNDLEMRILVAVSAIKKRTNKLPTAAAISAELQDLYKIRDITDACYELVDARLLKRHDERNGGKIRSVWGLSSDGFVAVENFLDRGIRRTTAHRRGGYV